MNNSRFIFLINMTDRYSLKSFNSFKIVKYQDIASICKKKKKINLLTTLTLSGLRNFECTKLV